MPVWPTSVLNQEFVIAGYVPRSDSPKSVGLLVLG